MRRIRMERVDIEDIDAATMSILNLRYAPTVTNTGDTDWVCGHCDEILLQLASDSPHAGVVFRCPHCHSYSRLRQVQ